MSDRAHLVGVVSVNDRGEIIAWNNDMTELFGHAASDVIGHDIELIMPERFRAGHHKGFRRYVETRRSSGLIGTVVEVYGLHKDGHEFPLEVFVTVSEADGALTLTNTMRDITDRRKTEELLKYHEPPPLSTPSAFLLVDPNHNDQRSIITSMRSNGIVNRITVAVTIEEALDYMLYRKKFFDRANLPYIVLLELLMPEASGLDLLRTMRATDELTHVPVIINTLVPESPEISALLEHGKTMYLRKPVSINDLNYCIKSIGFSWMAVLPIHLR